MSDTPTEPIPEPENTLQLKILDALEDQRYVARTIDGICKELGTSKTEILDAITSDQVLSTKIKVYPRRAKGGKLLITTRDKFQRSAPALDKFISLFGSKTEGTIHDII